MKTKKITLFLLCMLLPQLLLGQHTDEVSDSIYVKGKSFKDTLSIAITSNAPKYQLSFLMQGMQISIKDSAMNTIALLKLPNAKDVRERVKRHPNEVKAMHRQPGNEVRPDLEPLISMLNKTIGFAENGKGDTIEFRHIICIDKEQGVLNFSILLPHFTNIQMNDSIWLEINSRPTEIQEEFSGRHLSRENRRPPGGLGQAPNTMSDISRNIHFKKKIIIEK